MIRKVDKYFVNLINFGAVHYHGRDKVESGEGHVVQLHAYYAKFGYSRGLVSV